MSQVQFNDLRGLKKREFNVVDFGATGDGTTDDTAAIQRAVDAAQAAGGGVVYIPRGTYKVTDGIDPGVTAGAAYTILIRGAETTATIISVPATFNLSAAGVFVTWLGTMSLAIPNTNTTSVTDLTITFEQPDSDVRADYVQYPPAIYAEYVNHAHFDRLTIENAWDGIKIARGNGFQSTDCLIGSFNRAYDIDGLVDAARIDNAHLWPNNSTLKQSYMMMWDMNTYGFYVGRVDGLVISGAMSLFNWGMHVHEGVLAGVTGAPFVFVSDTNFDNGGVVWAPTSGGRIDLSNCRFTQSSSTTAPFDNRARNVFQYTSTAAGRVNITNCMFEGAGSVETHPKVDIDYSALAANDNSLNGVSISNSHFFQPLQDLDTIYVHTSGTGTAPLILSNNHFVWSAAQGAAVTAFAVHAVGPVKVIATGNDVTEKKGSTGSWFSADTDSGHVVTNNSALGWSMTYPATQASCEFSGNSGVLNPPIGSAVASGDPIVPTGKTFHVTGTAAIATITNWVAVGAQVVRVANPITIIPDGVFTWTNAGNIAVAGTAVVGRALVFTYDNATSKWYPSYV